MTCRALGCRHDALICGFCPGHCDHSNAEPDGWPAGCAFLFVLLIVAVFAASVVGSHPLR